MPVRGEQAKTMLGKKSGNLTPGKSSKSSSGDPFADAFVSASKKPENKALIDQYLATQTAAGAGAVGPGLQGQQLDPNLSDLVTSPFAGGQMEGPEAGFKGSGVGTWSPSDLAVDPRYGQSMDALRDIVSGEGYDNLLRQQQYEALTQVGPGEGIAGAVGQAGSRAGGQVAQQRQMSDIQMVQALAGAKVAAQQAKEQAAIAATSEMRNIMQQQLDAHIATQQLGLQAQEAVQNRATAFFNMVTEYMSAAVGANVIDDEGDFAQFGEHIRKLWEEWQNASPEEQLELSSKWPKYETEEDTDTDHIGNPE